MDARMRAMRRESEGQDFTIPFGQKRRAAGDGARAGLMLLDRVDACVSIDMFCGVTGAWIRRIVDATIKTIGKP
jgi:hypothetical protein